MHHAICLKAIRIAVLVVCVGLGVSACWVHDGYGRGGHDPHDDHHDDRR